MHLCVRYFQTAYLGLRGGKDVGTTTRKIMRTLMTNSLARCFNFVGHGAKHAFSALLLREVVNGSFLEAILLFSNRQ